MVELISAPTSKLLYLGNLEELVYNYTDTYPTLMSTMSAAVPLDADDQVRTVACDGWMWLKRG